MNNKTAFGGLHPLVMLAFFVLVLGKTMLCRDVFSAGISLLGAWMFNLVLNPFAALKNTIWKIVFFAVFTLINPLFSHNGATPVAFVNATAYTLEALIFGAVTAVMMLAVIEWCGVLLCVFTDDKLLWVFGRFAPRTALTISMLMHFIPEFRSRYGELKAVSDTLERESKSIFGSVKKSVGVFSALVSKTLEQSAAKAQYMNSKGFGKGRRTSFHRFRFTAQDAAFAGVFIILSAVCLTGNADISYYPRFAVMFDSTLIYFCYAAFAAISFLPLMFEASERIKWKYLILKI